MEEVVSRWKSLSITEKEGEIVTVNNEVANRAKQSIRFGLVGKLLSRKPFHKEAFRRTISDLWRVTSDDGKGLDISELGNDVFLFTFPNERERSRIIDMEPWTFNKSLLVLKELDDSSNPNIGDCVYAFVGLGSQFTS